MKTRVTIWNEYRHERQVESIASVYPGGIHTAIADHLQEYDEFEIKAVVLDDPEQGLTDAVMDNTDVLVWWSHIAHEEVEDELVKKIYEKVLCGMGLIVLHSSHYSKIFKKLMGTSCNLKWREAGEKERVWVIEPGHPIAEGLNEYFEIPRSEMYGERFDIPAPDTLVFSSWFQGGELFRSGCCYNRGYGKVFYFSPGHESFPIYHDKNVIRVIRNAIVWAKPVKILDKLCCPLTEPLEKLEGQA